MNLDLVDAAAGGEVGRAGGAGAIDLRSGETDEKGQIGRAGAEGLGFRMRPRACEAKQAWGGRSRSCVRTYVDGEAGGLEAAGRWVGEQGRRDGRLPQAPRRQHRRPHVSPPFFRSEFRRVFFSFSLLLLLPHSPPRGGDGGGGRTVQADSSRFITRPGSGKTASAWYFWRPQFVVSAQALRWCECDHSYQN